MEMNIRSGDREYLEYLIDKIMEPEYWSHGILNSEGRTLLNLIARILSSYHSELRRIIAKVRRNPTYENVSKLVEMIREIISSTD